MTKREEILRFIAQKIIDIQKPNAIIVAIDGVDGAGKTTLADQLVPILDSLGKTVIRSSIDNFHNSEEIRYQKGKDSSEGYYEDSFNYDALKNLLLVPLRENRHYQTVFFDYRKNRQVKSKKQIAPKNSVLVFDGVFLFRPEINEFWDFRIFVDVDFSVSVKRAVQRDIQSGLQTHTEEKYSKKYVPGQRLYLSKVDPKSLADMIIDNNDPQNPKVK